MNKITASLACLLFLGCGQQPNAPSNPKVDLSKGRKTHTIDVSDLTFPAGFPKEITLLEPVQIYEQQMETDAVTWDTSATVQEVRDYYLAEFKKLKYETFVHQPKDMPGENYEIRAFDQEKGVYFGVGVGKQRPESGVSCFIFANETTAETWNKPD